MGGEIFKMNIYTFVDTPIGRLYIAEENGFISYVGRNMPKDFNEGISETLRKATKQITQYLNGDYKDPFTLPLHITGTAFEQKVYNELINVGYGETVSYGELAAGIGSPNAARAVGNALHKNPLLLLVPCHRVIGSDGSLKNFALGADIKKFLIELEKG